MPDNLTPETYVSEITSVIQSRLVAEWADTTPIAYPFRHYKPSANTPYLKLDILWADSFDATMGRNSLNLNIGVIQLSVFVPNNNQGAGALNTLAGQARAIFSRYFGNGLRCDASSVAYQAESAWVTAIVRTRFEAFEIVNRS